MKRDLKWWLRAIPIMMRYPLQCAYLEWILRRNSKQEFVGLLNGVPQIYVHEDHCSAPRRLRGEK
jgi:hypothetical protein